MTKLSRRVAVMWAGISLSCACILAVQVSWSCQLKKTWFVDDPIRVTINQPQYGAKFACGAEVPCSGSATDQDRWTTEDGGGGPLGDDIAWYAWEANGGTWKNGVSTGANVTWIAPDQPGLYHITLTADDVDGLPAGDEGSRNDAVGSKSVTVEVCKPVVVITFPFQDTDFKWGLQVIVKGSVSGFCSTPVMCQLDVDGSLKGEISAVADGSYKFCPPGPCWDTESAGTARGWHNIVVKASDLQACQAQSAARRVFVRRMVWPVGGWPTGEYCDPRPNGRHHNGIDIAASEGTPVAAAEDGHASAVAYQDLGGYYRSVTHGTWYVELLDPANTSYRTASVSTTYCHLQQSGEQQDDVLQGNPIGAVGHTGSGSCFHLHFIVRESGAAVNPRAYLP